MKRQHQLETEQIVDGIISGSGIRNIIEHILPGGGKSAIPMIAGRLIAAGKADHICWVVPRKSLQDQGERNFIDPFFRQLFDHRMMIRSSTNEDDPSRGLSGFVTTYQAIGIDEAQTVLFELLRRRYILILDEFHHLELDGIWHKAIQPIYDAAAYRILMTGTLERGDQKKIAFMPYRETSQGSVPELEDSADTAIVKYGRTAALQERAIIPLKFHLSDARAAWIDRQGQEHNVSSISRIIKRTIAPQAVFTVISSEFADQLLDTALRHWQSWRERQPRAKFLIVTAGIDQAKKIAEDLESLGLRSDIATSHESAAAHHAIKKYKSGALDCLVCIAMCYEGMDVPEISHICCLTNIRSNPWITQMVGRAVRIDRNGAAYEDQAGFIFAPDDILMREIVEDIRREQLPFVTRGEQLGLFGSEGGNGGGRRETITPLGSEMIGAREVELQSSFFDNPAVAQTPKDLETELRKRIDSHVKKYAWLGRFKEASLNRQILEIFGKRRAQMTIPELRAVEKWVFANFDLLTVRGSRRRVAPRAQVWHGQSI